MTGEQPNNPLHGVTLETMLTRLVEDIGWLEMSRVVKIKCFTTDPSIKSSLTFLRKTPWARSKVEALYLQYERRVARRQRRSARRSEDG